MYKSIILRIAVIFSALMCQSLSAQVIDPKAYILKNGYQTMEKEDSGKIVLYTALEIVNSAQIISMEIDIEKLPKAADVKNYCERLRDGIKAKLISETGTASDVVVTNYGNNGYTVACVLKYKEVVDVGRQTLFGTQLIYFTYTNSAQYMVFFTD